MSIREKTEERKKKRKEISNEKLSSKICMPAIFYNMKSITRNTNFLHLDFCLK